ncbi:hypothetical protein N802_12745 [Knoellia sinensis KCTC 19936]|uniref:Cholesterol esterase n=1 Tax=Knoellia sinensis KCTC 19936 TaxID=1385520 RepID=A0A0A0JC94_9MICO|nr:DUF6230 family protein [Knoellia sinensis]KGN34414.1 hypothetical protein N802_12745 [Knoellia sinensis KCTC 19936]
MTEKASNEQSPPTRAAHGTRWGRAAFVALPALALMGGTLGMLKSNVIASQITVQKGTAEFSTGRVHGDVVAMGIVTVPVSTGVAGQSTPKPVLRTGFAGANLNGFCFSQIQQLAGVNWTIKVTSGDDNPNTFESTGKNIVFDVTEIRGTSDPGINLDGLVEIGPRASSLRTIPDPNDPTKFLDNPLEAPTTGNYLGIQASIGELYQLRGKVYDMQIGGPLNLPNLDITVTRNGQTCNQLPIKN